MLIIHIYGYQELPEELMGKIRTAVERVNMKDETVIVVVPSSTEWCGNGSPMPFIHITSAHLGHERALRHSLEQQGVNIPIEPE